MIIAAMSSFIGPSQMLLYERQFMIASFTREVARDYPADARSGA